MKKTLALILSSPRCLAVLQSRHGQRHEHRQAHGGARAQDLEPPVLRRHAPRRPGGRRPPRRHPAGAGGRARDRRREADADRREPDPDGHPGALHHAERLARDRVRPGQGEGRQGADRRRRHACRRQGGRRCRRAHGDVRRIGQLRRRQARGRLPRQGRRAARHASASSRAFPATKPATRRLRGFRDARQGVAGHHDRRRRSRRTGSATRGSTCSRTCCRRIPTSTACSRAAI